jgi:hypothetical protein
VGQRRQIDAHECDQRAEVEQLGPIVIADKEGANQRNHSHENHVVGGNSGPGMDGAEELLGNGVATSHAVEQASRAQLRSHPGTDGRDKQREADRLGQQGAARNSRYVAKSVLHLARREHVLRTQQLCPVHLS